MSSMEKGARVKLSAAGLDHLAKAQSANVKVLYGSNTRGTVVGLVDDPIYVRVLRDGTKSPQTYHRSFWELE